MSYSICYALDLEMQLTATRSIWIRLRERRNGTFNSGYSKLYKLQMHSSSVVTTILSDTYRKKGETEYLQPASTQYFGIHGLSSFTFNIILLHFLSRRKHNLSLSLSLSLSHTYYYYGWFSGERTLV